MKKKKGTLIALFLVILLSTSFFLWENKVTGFEDLGGPWSVGTASMERLEHLQDSIGGYIIDSVNSNSPFKADFVADPFFFKDSSGIHLFVEHIVENHGDITYFFAKDMAGPFLFRDIALDEDFHLSYPLVFDFQERYYMLPETQKSGKVILYTTDSFPLGWRREAILIEESVQDPTLFIKSENEFYIFGSLANRMHCWKSSSLTGPYAKVSTNILVGIEARAGGRIFEWEGRHYLPVQSSSQGYGTGVSLYEISLEPEVKLKKRSHLFLGPRPDFEKFSHGMHHIDVQFHDGKYFVAYDGNDKLGGSQFNWKFFLKFNFMNLWNELIN